MSDNEELSSPAERVLTSHDLLPLIWSRLDNADDREALWKSSNAILEAVAGSAASQVVYHVRSQAAEPWRIPPIPAGAELPITLHVDANILPDAVLSAVEPWLDSAASDHLHTIDLTIRLQEHACAAWLHVLAAHPGLRSLSTPVPSRTAVAAGHQLLSPSLTSLTLTQPDQDSPQPDSLDWLSHLTSLRSLTAEGAVWQEDLHWPWDCLSTLTALRCASAGNPRGMTALIELQQLQLSAREITFLPRLASVTDLTLVGCTLGDILLTARFPGVERLLLSGCTASEQHWGLQTATQLTSLRFEACWCALEEFTHMRELREIAISNIGYFHSVWPLLELRRLEDVSLPRMHQALWLAELTGITALSFECDRFGLFSTSIDRLSKLRRLASLEVCGAGDLRNVDGAATFSGLTHLGLRGCGGVPSVAALSSLTALQSLCVTECGELGALEAFAGSSVLKVVTATDCHRLLRVDVSRCGSLTYLDVTGCSGLRVLHCAQCSRLSLSRGLRMRQNDFLESVDSRGCKE